MTTEAAAPISQRASLRRVALAGALAALAATIGNLIILLIAQSLLGVSFVIPPPQGSTEPFTITAGNVILDTVIMVLGAAVVYTLICRVSPQPTRVFIIISAVILILSFMFPLLLRAPIPTKIALAVMHTQTAINVITIFRRIAPPV